MAVIVKGEITITKGFNHWKEMVFSQKEKMAGMGMQFLFAGTTKEDPTKLIAVMKFDSVEAMIERAVAAAVTGDSIVVMSNGGFDGLHQRLLTALAER